MISLHFDNTDGILLVRVSGEVTLEELTATSKSVMAGNNLPEVLKILEFAGAEIDRVSMGDLDRRLTDLLEGSNRKFHEIRHAIVTDNPRVVAYASLVKQKHSHSGYVVNIFSTEKAARNWLRG